MVMSEKKGVLKQLCIVTVVCIVFMITEIVGGLLANSIAIMADAAHLLSDLTGFSVSIYAVLLSRRKNIDPTYTFGMVRAAPIGALTSIFIIWILTAWLFYKAILRLINKPEVDGKLMLIVAIIGLGCNLTMAKVLHGTGMGHSHSHGGHGGHGGHGAHDDKDERSQLLDEHDDGFKVETSPNRENKSG